MKRFFCTTCKRVRRVRRVPKDVVVFRHDDGKVERYGQGTCDYHDRGNVPRSTAMNRQRVPAPRPERKASTPPAERKSKR